MSLMAFRSTVPALCLGLLVTLLASGCETESGSPPPAPEPPPEEVLREALLAVLSAPDAPAAVPADRLAVAVLTPEGFDYRAPTAEELAALWLPAQVEDVTIESMSCRYFPVWRVVYRPTIAGREGPPLVSEVVPIDGVYKLLIRWRAAILNDEGRLVPDFRPGALAGSIIPAGGDRVTVVAQPPWVDLRPQERE